jgi:signal transduction histidine kinase
MNINSIPALITAITSIILGVFVYLRGTKLTSNRTWALLSCCVAVWSFSIVLIMHAPNERMALIWARMVYFGAIPIPATLLHFTLSYLQETRNKRVLISVAYLLTILFLGLNCTDFLIKGVAPQKTFRYFGIPGQAYFAFVFVWVGLVISCFYETIKAYRISSGIQRNQIKYLLFAYSIGMGGGITTFLPAFGINYGSSGYYFVGLYTLIITYAIVKHRLMDISFVVKKGATYAYASFLLLIPLLVLVFYGQKSAFGTISFPFSFTVVCTIFIATYFFPKVKVKAEKTIEQYIFKDKYDYKKTISNLSKAMVSILNLNELCRTIITTTTDAMMVKTASIYVLNEEEGFYKQYESMGDTGGVLEARYSKDDPFFSWIERHNEIFIREELERYTTDTEARQIASRLKQMGSELCIPLIAKQKLIGLINLGVKGKGDMYTHEDLDLLATLSNQATIALENARLYEDISRAKVQMQRADRLASLGTLTAGLAHEIRNPLVAIKTFTQLLPERFDDSEFREHFLNVTAGEVDRISSLVTELLDFARPSQPKLNKEDLNQVVEKMLLLVDTESHKKNVQVVKKYYELLPPVVLDQEQIKQVLLNILLNAVDATPEDGTISVTTKPVKRNGSIDYVQIEISDTGKGIANEDLDKVFTPFYTTKHEGSGLGLAISYQIIQEHQGTIEVESTKDKGTTFRINLPVNPLLMKEEKQRSQ